MNKSQTYRGVMYVLYPLCFGDSSGDPTQKGLASSPGHEGGFCLKIGPHFFPILIFKLKPPLY
jgi:hypothetical protein